MAPDHSRISLRLDYFLWDRNEEWKWSQEQLIKLGAREDAQLGVIDPRGVEDGVVLRMERAYPVYDLQYHENVAIVRHWCLKNLSNLQTIGRNGLPRDNDQDHLMLTGVYAARNVTGERYDVWSVNTEREYHEEDRVAETMTVGRLAPTQVALSGGRPRLECDATSQTRPTEC